MINNCFEALKWASSFLKTHHADENAGEILLQHRLGLNRTELLLAFHEPLITEDREWLIEKVTEHVTVGTPVQQIIGEEMFYGRSYMVTPDVLIPRPETEEVVLHALEQMNIVFGVDHPLDIVDIGTGSGAIAISIAKERAASVVTAVDLSEKALKVATYNAEQLAAKVTFVEGDLLKPFLHKQNFDVVISNPPYISKSEMEDVLENVKGHEPIMALTDESDGLTFYRRIVAQLGAVMKNRLLVVFEIGHSQGKSVTQLLETAFPDAITDLQVVKDLNGKDRIVSALIERGK